MIAAEDPAEVTADQRYWLDFIAEAYEVGFQAYVRVAREGLFAEPASAASVAGLLQLHEAGELAPRATIVCVLTGHGLKDPEWAIAGAAPPRGVPADAAAVAAELGL